MGSAAHKAVIPADHPCSGRKMPRRGRVLQDHLSYETQKPYAHVAMKEWETAKYSI